ncbi:transcriptional regulator MntR [Clostridium pasteurianum DSM 525 = ATCC 6013]|uniref:Manganese transport regulator n=1 Tax=Clostridium pasteurianum DSM 525 = ATCC 6013 TaxID=1262449 RepID=A0A0H3J8H8_CLOPA|nr:iron dependent repressor, metal binding and dimerization domain protein [Clostridium pasteurianum]AJA48238.1 transcriptional regulator MntR [Clostridium pasteurianum DSM 525 = ATCC 6013]AJA52226.1 transcriptional regulator MntR [Clostridium pasteurianum DSM 525 = ATCC 6013]AOZ75496.1 Fur family transcriptional regulator [Clostridium pasteurianum DSM 525 = ATCC 6013]AOZ79291.1 Fur family transcriptional regulator [Clostridium pasteurianum]ELP60610.1 iron-dependent transcriptional repressor [
MSKESFYTFNEYMRKEEDTLTASMEDYLEMIYRLSLETHFTRIHDLAKALNVQPPSATKMVQKLSDYGLINYERYGIILLTDKGKVLGNFLLDRHNTIENFLKLLGISNNILEQTEKIEHTLSNDTLIYLKNFVDFIESNPDLIKNFNIFCHKKNNS